MAALLILGVGGLSFSRAGVYERLMGLDRWISHLTPRSVNAGGMSLSYLERPGGGDTIVLLHGFGADKDNWVRFVRHLPAGYRVIALDLPGHGDSAKPVDRTYSVEFFTQSFAQAADALKLGRFHLVGNSMGGYVSMLYASRNPGRVMDLCLMDTAGIFTGVPGQSDLMAALARGESPLTPATKEEFDRLLDFAFYHKPFMPWPVKSVLADRAVESAPLLKKMFKDFNANLVDPVPLLPGLDLPVLVLWGERDRILHVSTTIVLEKNLPREKTVIMKDCGHMPMLEKPRETARHYLDFLNAHAAGKAG